MSDLVTEQPWKELVQRAKAAGINTKGMKREAIEAAITASDAPPAPVSNLLTPDEQADVRALFWEELAAMPLELLYRQALRRGLAVQDAEKNPLRMADIIEEILAYDERKEAAELAAATSGTVLPAAAAPVEPEPALAPDPAFTDGKLRLSRIELALACAALLPPDARVTPLIGHVETFTRAAIRQATPGEVVFSHNDATGQHRRYRITLPDTVEVDAEAIG